MLTFNTYIFYMHFISTIFVLVFYVYFTYFGRQASLSAASTSGHPSLSSGANSFGRPASSSPVKNSRAAGVLVHGKELQAAGDHAPAGPPSHPPLPCPHPTATRESTERCSASAVTHSVGWRARARARGGGGGGGE